ncbi:aspartyl/asparaginyl beta-hydroxylase domain-containing protein [Massilia sp. CT11-108]|uniref:aspartyl/asparaginyl beta-hydroxylase domain-containing protein n=1 Tax=Massilia sp. CT11-108 TaxID=3393900 RepID=UPI0039A451CF
MRNFLLLAQGVDVTPLLLAIRRRSDLWKEDTYLRDYPQGPFKQIESIMLRFPVKSVHETEEELQNHLSTYDQHENVDYPAYKLLTEARPIVMSLMTRVGGERLGRVMINKIAPGGVIYPHVDTKSHTDYYSRFHVVLQSQPGVYFRAGEETTYMAPGEVWWFDNAQEHEVINNSAGDRIHMIVDIRTSK